MIRAFRVTYNSDLTEGRGPAATMGYTTSRAAAVYLADKCPKVMGVADNSYIEEITIFDSIDEFDKSTADGIRRKALAKLTPEERTVLGV